MASTTAWKVRPNAKHSGGHYGLYTIAINVLYNVTQIMNIMDAVSFL